LSTLSCAIAPREAALAARISEKEASFFMEVFRKGVRGQWWRAGRPQGAEKRPCR
jgi:hypothetical protein